MFEDPAQRTASSSALLPAEYVGLNGVSGSQQQWQPQQTHQQANLAGSRSSDYDNFLASTGLGVKSQLPQPERSQLGIDTLSRDLSGLDFLASGMQNGTLPPQKVSSMQQMLANLSRPPSSGQLPVLKPCLPVGIGDGHGGRTTPQAADQPPMGASQPSAGGDALLGQARQEPPSKHVESGPTAIGANQGLMNDASNALLLDGGASAGIKHLVSQSSDIAALLANSGGIMPADIQQLLSNMAAANANGISRPASRNATIGPPPGSVPDGQPPVATTGTTNDQGTPQGGQPPHTEAPAVPLVAMQEATQGEAAKPQGMPQPGVTPFAAVAGIALEDNPPVANVQDAPGSTPSAGASTMAAPGQVAPNLFDPPFAAQGGSTGQVADPSGAALPTPVGQPEVPLGSGVDTALLQQLQQQLGGAASYNDILDFMRLHAQQQALAQQQRVQAARAGAQAPVLGMFFLDGCKIFSRLLELIYPQICWYFVL
jgi:hypothetical protein